MLRVLWFLVVVFLAVAGLVWLLERPGSVVLDWQGYRLETSFFVMVGTAAALAIMTALLYRGWLILVRAPGRVGEVWRERRRNKGYRALTQGMVAVAAGDAGEASRQVRRAEVLLNEPPLTLLLSAQSALLNGDDLAATRFFKEMTEVPETEFLGLRGLLTQALKASDDERALELAKRAHRLQPKSKWILTSLFDLQVRSGNWLDAQVTANEQARLGITSRDDNKQRKAVLAVQQGLELNSTGDAEEAGRRFKAAYDLAPTLISAAVHHAGSLIFQGKHRLAADVLTKVWARQPHPDLIEPCWRATQADDALSRVKATEKLTLASKDHLESRIALAGVCLEAQLWGEARQHLGGIDKGADEARVCQLWADLEESEHGNMEAVQAWLKRAALAYPDPAWVCTSCGNAVSEWSAICGNCGGFDSFRWGRAPHVLSLTDKANKPATQSDTSSQLPIPVEN